jgi:hypothetical protein
VPQDIHSASHAKKTLVENESPKVDTPLSPYARNSTPKMSKPPGPEDMENPASAKGVPTSPSDASLGHDATHQSHGPEPTLRPKASPHSPKSFGLGVPSGCQPSEGSSMPRSGKQPHQYSHVAESPWDNPDFIQAVFHIGRYITTSVNTERPPQS